MKKRKAKIWVYARKTPGDDKFYDRWYSLGEQTTEVSETDIIVVDQHVTVCDKFIKTMPKLRYVCSPTTGHTHLQFESGSIQVVTLRGETHFLAGVTSVSEFVFYMIMRLLSEPFTLPPRRKLSGKSIGIIGHGRIGKHVERLARGFKMIPYMIDKENTKEQWEAVFRTVDIISVHLSEGPKTKGRVSAELINKMKEGSYFINTARASIVDEDALLAAVKRRQIQAAALDVCSDPAKFRCEPRVLITPHIAGTTLEDRIKTDEFLIAKTRNIIRHADDPFLV